MNFIESFYFIAQHPKCMWKGKHQTFPYGLDIMPVLVNPETMEVDDDDSKNTKQQVWLEYGQYQGDEPTHDIGLDCGADTFEEAIIKLAELVKIHYGDYEADAAK